MKPVKTKRGAERRSGIQYFLGGFDGTRFTCRPQPEPLWLGYGPDHYAAVTFSNVKAPILMGWMNNWAYGRTAPTSPWRGAMATPRRLALTTNGARVCQLPVDGHEKMRLLPLHLPGPFMAPAEFALEVGGGARLEFKNASAERLTLSATDTEIVLDRTHARARANTMTETARAPFAPGSVRILVDVSSIEVFMGEGASSLTALYYTEQPLDVVCVEGPLSGRAWSLAFLGPELSQTGKLIYAYATYTAVMLAFTAINVPYSALLAVISPVAEERTKATQFRFIFASLGTLCVGAFTTPLVDWLGGDDQVLGFRRTITLFAVLSILVFWTTFATTRERIRPKGHDSSVRDDMSALVKNVSWIVLVVTGILIVIGLVARFASIVFYLKYYLMDDGSRVFLIFDRTALMTSCGLIGQLFGALLTPWFVLRIEKHYLLACMALLHAVLLVVCFVVPPEQFSLLVVLHSVGIFTFGVIITLLFSMYTDCAEYGEWSTGKNAAGLTVSASMFSLKFGSAVGGALPGFMLAWFEFVPNAVQSDWTVFGIRLMFNVVPAVFFLAGGLFMAFYRLDRETLSKVEVDLRARRLEAAA